MKQIQKINEKTVAVISEAKRMWDKEDLVAEILKLRERANELQTYLDVFNE